mgnify:CR=1 FL=1
MTIRRRIEKLEAQRGGGDEVYLVRWDDGQEIAVLDLRGTGVTWPRLFASIASEGRTINERSRSWAQISRAR